jgi:MFS family permease
LAERDFRRLFAVRLVSQAGDGIVTAGVGTYVFFNAASFPSPSAAAAAFVVLYVPYSLIGPFAGVLIDRWSRRQILFVAALIRSAFVVITAAVMATGNRGVPLYVAVLLVLGVNRFFLASLSASLPHVVAEDKLVMANSVSPTAGGIVGAIGGIIALGLNAATGDTERGAAVTLLVAGCCYVAAGLVAATMRRDLLGPQFEPGSEPGRLLGELDAVVADLVAAARYTARRRGPATALGAIGAG